MGSQADGPVIHVIAGAPGAGKTSIGGAMLHALGLDYFDPESYARAVCEAGETDVRLCLADGWRESVRRLKLAIAERRSHVFETTLAGSTIPALLRMAADRGMRVRIWYFGLSDPDLLVYRAARRAEHGGFPRLEADVRRAWGRSLEGLVYLLPHVDALRLFDNSTPRAAGEPVVPEPRELMRYGEGVASWTIADPASIPDWAKPVFEATFIAAEPPMSVDWLRELADRAAQRPAPMPRRRAPGARFTFEWLIGVREVARTNLALAEKRYGIPADMLKRLARASNEEIRELLRALDGQKDG